MVGGNIDEGVGLYRKETHQKYRQYSIDRRGCFTLAEELVVVVERVWECSSSVARQTRETDRTYPTMMLVERVPLEMEQQALESRKRKVRKPVVEVLLAARRDSSLPGLVKSLTGAAARSELEDLARDQTLQDCPTRYRHNILSTDVNVARFRLITFMGLLQMGQITQLSLVTGNYYK